jgi:predicted metal-binding membrane protein
MVAARIRSMTRAHWLALFGGLLACWTALALMSAPGIYEALCRTGAGAAGFPAVAAMWALMGLAMMLPTALPAFATYDDLPGTDARGFGALVLGFAAVWAGFALPAAALQVWVSNAGLLTTPAFTAALFAAAGLYQLSAMKAACLTRCRMPLTVFMSHWAAGPFRIGLRLGADCLGCCWALMALGLIGGTMSLGFMGLAMLLMAMEKLPDIGEAITRPLGVGLIALATLTLLI